MATVNINDFINALPAYDAVAVIDNTGNVYVKYRCRFCERRYTLHLKNVINLYKKYKNVCTNCIKSGPPAYHQLSLEDIFK